jgi:hypothetical protein
MTTKPNRELVEEGYEVYPAKEMDAWVEGLQERHTRELSELTNKVHHLTETLRIERGWAEDWKEDSEKWHKARAGKDYIILTIDEYEDQKERAEAWDKWWAKEGEHLIEAQLMGQKLEALKEYIIHLKAFAETEDRFAFKKIPRAFANRLEEILDLPPSRIALDRSDEKQHGWVYLRVDGKLIATVDVHNDTAVIAMNSRSLAQHRKRIAVKL